MAQDSAGVATPPPLVYLAGFVLGLGLDTLVPIPAVLPQRFALPIGLILILAWLVTWVAALPRFAQAKTPLSTRKPVQALITSGIFGVTRNPLYIGWTCLYLGAATLLNAWWAIVLLVPVAIIIDRAVVRKEEDYLERRFGSVYLDYKRKVRRWL
jgi:protein-S-isoprenylcysteine O-methyltransferase Ste14